MAASLLPYYMVFSFIAFYTVHTTVSYYFLICAHGGLTTTFCFYIFLSVIFNFVALQIGSFITFTIYMVICMSFGLITVSHSITVVYFEV